MTDAKSPPPRAAPKARTAKVATTVRDTAEQAARAARETARDVTGKTVAGIEANPLGVLAGGIALGVIAGVFVPRGAREAGLLAPVGKRLADTARGAVDAARDTAKSELDVLGLSRNAARDQVGKVLGDVIKTLTAAGTAALTAAKIAAPEPADPQLPTARKPAAKKVKPQA